ncbi:Bgt-51802 [Blumeria graminis f. sp. tritici]|uniref:Bgt-51802 n=1 Tax=Blumeria graminis f. sp. tritici TaxID=62690 RepID=A0A9X9QBK5_BLUGR|nr:Bgt-51802 [Blumeria graminis f. sp. tritici]
MRYLTSRKLKLKVLISSNNCCRDSRKSFKKFGTLQWNSSRFYSCRTENSLLDLTRTIMPSTAIVLRYSTRP